MRGAVLVVAMCFAGCAGGGEAPGGTGDTGWVDTDVPCYPHGPPRLDVGEGAEGWGIDGIDIITGIPPQGGAPYARFRVRVANLELSDGAEVLVHLYDRDDVLVGHVEVMSGFVCANVGDNADHWVTPEVHARFDGLELLELHEVPVRIEASVVGLEESVVASGEGTLMVDEHYLD